MGMVRIRLGGTFSFLVAPCRAVSRFIPVSSLPRTLAEYKQKGERSGSSLAWSSVLSFSGLFMSVSLASGYFSVATWTAGGNRAQCCPEPRCHLEDRRTTGHDDLRRHRKASLCST